MAAKLTVKIQEVNFFVNRTTKIISDINIMVIHSSTVVFVIYWVIILAW